MPNYHQVQLQILQKLMYSQGLKYSELKPAGMEGSQFTFHLDKLTNLGLISKQIDENSKAKYELTLKGKEIAGKMDLGDVILKSQAKVSVVLVCVDAKTSKPRYLLYTRFKSPFYSFQGFPTGKVILGENILECAKRELKEETGLTGKPELFAIRHYKIFGKNKTLLEDKIFFACKFINPKGVLVSGPEGKYEWVDEDGIWDFLKKPVGEIEDLLQALNESNLTFSEKGYITSEF